MGRKASHVALECTLQSHPNLVSIIYFFSSSSVLNLFPSIKLYAFLQVILGEEVAASKLTLFDIATRICDAVQDRAAQGS